MNYKHTDKQILDAVTASNTWAGVCRLLGTSPRGGNQTHIKKRAVSCGADHSHFVGQGWMKGKTCDWSRVPASVYLALDGKPIKSHDLKNRIIRDGIKSRMCEQCGLSLWLDKPMPLELHHLNGNHKDNRLDNLQILCPNCHAQTPNYTGKIRSIDATKNIGKSITSRMPTPRPRRVVWPSPEDLAKMIEEMPVASIGKKYGLSGNAVAKWCKHYKIRTKPRGYWAKLYAENAIDCASVS